MLQVEHRNQQIMSESLYETFMGSNQDQLQTKEKQDEKFKRNKVNLNLNKKH